MEKENPYPSSGGITDFKPQKKKKVKNKRIRRKHLIELLMEFLGL